MTDPSRAEAQRSSGSRQRPSELLRIYVSDPQLPRPDEIERLVSELDFRQNELELQNQRLQEAQRQLEAYRDRYIDLYDFAPLGYVTLDGDGYIQEINLAGAKLLGRELGELVGYPFTDCVVLTDRATFLEHIQKCCGQHQEMTSELGLFAKDGRLVAVQLHSVPVNALEQEGTFCKTAITDISDRRRAEEALRESEQFYRTLIETLPVTVVLADAKGRVSYISPAAKEMFDLAPGEGLGTVPTDWIAPEHHEVVRQRMRQVMVGLHPQPPVEYKMLKRDRTPVWAQVASAPVLDREGRLKGVVTVCQDITARKQAEQALRENDERLRLAIRGAEMGWWDWDLLSGEMTADDQCKALWGLPPTAQPSYELTMELTHPEDRPALQHRLQELMEAPAERDMEFRTVWPNGTVRWLLVRGRAFRDDRGRPMRMMGLVEDITERRRAAEEVAASRASAEQANRAKDHFLAVLSHELRAPLTPVVMGVSMLQNRPDLDPVVRETLEMVRRNTEMEARLIDDLLDVTRIARGKVELTRRAVEVCTVIQQAVEVCRPDIDARRLHFGVDWGPSPPYWVEADMSRLQQVFWNLLRNAIKFTPHGGCVGIRCRPDGTHVVIEVNDSGMGIEAEALPRVFNAFEQVEQFITRQFGGLGLGLTISKALVEMHGGTISAHSEGKGKGATFSVRLPLTAPVCQSAVPPPAASPQRAGRPLHILLVEDHGVTAKMMQMVLTAEGHTVETAGDVAAALELAGQQPFDLLLSDLGLPDGSGHDLMRQLRERGQALPGIALSGYGQQDDIRRSRETGFAAHLTKPASRETLIATIVAVTVGEPAAIILPTGGCVEK